MICENCGKEFFEDWRKDKKSIKTKPRFCSRSCANARHHSEETKQKISTSINNFIKQHPEAFAKFCENRFIKLKPKKICQECGKKIGKKNKTGFCWDCYCKNNNIEKGSSKPQKIICKNCGKEFIGFKKRLFCSSDCSIKFKHEEKYKNFLQNNEKYCNSVHNIKSFYKDFLKEQNDVCAICGCNQEHNGKHLVFICDHIDGNAANNKRENLRMICPNCDSQLDTFKSKNKNSARAWRRTKNS